MAFLLYVIAGCLAQMEPSLRDASAFPEDSPPASTSVVATGTSTGACCMGETCVEMFPATCEVQGGYPAPQVTSCSAGLCERGACCIEPDECIDDDGFGGPMDEQLCDILFGTYVGGASCIGQAPCPFQKLPSGYEIIEISPPELNHFQHGRPKINDCGEIVFGVRILSVDIMGQEIYHYDNGKLKRLTENEIVDTLPVINDDGIIVWGQNNLKMPMPLDLFLRAAAITEITSSSLKAINSNGYMSGDKTTDPESCAYPSKITYYDGEKVTTLFEDGLSNQGTHINDSSHIVWTRYEFCCDPKCGFFDWTSDLPLYVDGKISYLPQEVDQSGVSDINNFGRVAGLDAGAVIWQNGLRMLIEPQGNMPGLNDRGDIVFCKNISGIEPWQVRLLRGGQLHRISNPDDIEDSIHNIRPRLNEQGEIAWWWHHNTSLQHSGIRMLRKIRTGDIDLDLDVDRDDFAKFVQCYTGPGDFDRLCECRFLDIDHDRDVDADDYALFLSNYTGTLEDCDDNGQSDFDDLLFGTALDCNRNGIPDVCDIANGTSPDADENGIPDDCVYDIPKPIWREIFPVWTNRFLTMVPRKEWGSVALRVTLTSLHHVDPPYTGGPTSAYSAFEGGVRWVGPPTQYVESSAGGVPFWTAKLQCAPHYQLWEGIDLLHVTGAEVVPSSEYHVQAVSIGCLGREEGCAWMSEPVRIKTARWGDIVEPYNPPSTATQPDLADVSALVNKFRGTPDAPGKALAIIAPNDVYGDITPATLGVDLGFTHIAACVDAFRGAPYPVRPGRCATGGGPCAVDSDCAGANAPPCALSCN